MTELSPLTMTARLAVAAAIGLAVGTEREWSGPPAGPHRRFAGLRTFLLFGVLGGTGGLFVELDAPVAAGVLLAAGGALNLIAYAMTARRADEPLDGTTEAAALVVLALGVLAAMGYLALAAGCGAVVVYALGEKQRLHALVGRIGKQEMHAALEFLVLALAVLPILPTGPYPAFLDFRPRLLWAMVLLLSGLSFVAYIARRAVGTGKGYGVVGALGGLISSTALTLQFSRMSRAEPQYARGLGLGVLTACTVLPLRVLTVSLVLNPLVAREVLVYVIPALVVGAAASFVLLRDSGSVDSPTMEPRNPLRLGMALQMALLFEVAMVVVTFARERWGSSGLIGSSVLISLTDLDALTISMNRLAGGASVAVMAARGIGIGLLTNTVAKLTIALVVGERRFRRLAGAGLVATAIVLVGALWWQWG